MRKIGLIINPYAGVGGKSALKGSDGAEIVKEALARGGKLESEEKVATALSKLQTQVPFKFIVGPGKMGECVVAANGLPYEVINWNNCAECEENRCQELAKDEVLETTSEDTKRAAKEMLKNGVELLLFAGGDGTARDIFDAVGQEILVLGIPTGCKIHSGVYARTPIQAIRLLEQYLLSHQKRTKEAEVMDLDEDAFRKGSVRARLYGYMRVFDDQERMQSKKASAPWDGEKTAMQNLCSYLTETMQRDILYIIGSGSTTMCLKDNLNMQGTLLGVDLFYNGKMVGKDCTEQAILDALEQYPKRKIIVTVIGGQGYVFGRGNQQLSADVLKRVGKDQIEIIATKNKMQEFFCKPLYLDTGDLGVNEMLQGYYRVTVGRKEYVMMKVVK